MVHIWDWPLGHEPPHGASGAGRYHPDAPVRVEKSRRVEEESSGGEQ